MYYDMKASEVEVMRWLVERQLPQLRFELARTEDPEFRNFIHRRIDELEALDRRLAGEMAQPPQPAV